MVELFVRLGVCLAFLAMGLLGFAPVEVGWKAAAAFAAVSVFGWLLERRGMKNSGVAGFFAIGEAFILALFLAASGGLDRVGFLVLIPCLYAGAEFGSSMVSMAPLAATGLIAAGGLFSKSGLPEPQVFMHAAGVLSVSLLLGQRRVEVAVEPSLLAIEPERSPQLVEDGLLQLRENFRKLRDAYGELERRSRKDKIASRIAKAQAFEGPKFYTELRSALCDLSRAEELAVYTLATLEQVLVVRDVSDGFPGELKAHSIEVDVSKAPAFVREQAEDALSALDPGAQVSNVLLIHKGKVVGMVCAIEAHEAKLNDIQKALAEAAPVAAAAIDSEIQREGSERRLRELELLYEMSSLASGATTATSLAGRIVRELMHSLHLDSCGVVFVEGESETVLAKQGSQPKLLDCMSFAEGPGLKGWIATGCPELVLFDARVDQRCDPGETLKRRVGSFILVPLWIGTELAGYVNASTQIAGGIDTEQIESLRLIAAELSRSLERISGSKPGGLMTPQEFATATAGQDGVLVYLEPLRKEQMITNFGHASFEESLRKLAHQVRAKLPEGSCLCRRDQGDFLVFLDTSEEFARNWANEVAASASFIALSSSESAKRVPLALRAKVAQVTSQSDRLSKEIAA